MKVLAVAAAVAGIGIVAFPTGSDSCSIAPPVPVFAPEHRPADLGGQFLKGRIGVIRPSYDRSYLIAAYRILNGKPLSEKEASGLFVSSSNGLVPPFTNASATAWLQVRNRALGGVPLPFLDTYRSKNSDGSFAFYPNCLANAFDTAVETFEKRSAAWGIGSLNLHEWVTAQDQVFANCSGKVAVIPAPPSDGMDPLLAADRQYQIAAAYFYAGEWAKARDAFDLVAKDANSPWKSVAPYLIARTYLREGTVDNKPDAMREAASHFDAITKDAALSEWHEASRELLDYVRLRLDPQAGLGEFGASITQPAAADYLYLLGHTDPEVASATSDLTDWLLTFEGHTKNADHATAQWKKTRSPAWLIAALVRGNDAEAVQAARHVDHGAPEYEAVTYYGVLRETDADQRRAWADEALQQDLLLATRNLILTERLKLARDWKEFLRDAPRKPEPKLEDFDGSEVDASKPPVATGTASLFDADATGVLNGRVPFSLWKDASGNRSLPAHLQLEMVEGAWVRAVVLGKDAEARQLMERLVQLQPRAEGAAHDYLTAADPEAGRFAATFLLLRNTDLMPFLVPASSAVDLNKTHTLGQVDWGFSGSCATAFAPVPAPDAGFLTEKQQAENQDEWKQLAAAAPSGAGYIATQTFAWETKHPDDPRVQEALHLLVETGRRACRDDQTVENGRRAFVLLHERYPNSEWTKKTKYWYQ
jgi:hypothetical protein